MENYPNLESVKPGFTLTSKVIAKGTFEQKNNASNPMSDYVSTANQSTLVSENQNAAIRNSWMANFALNSSSAVKNYNSMMLKAQMCK